MRRENKAADQLCGNRTADQRLCFHFLDSTFPLLSISEISNLPIIFCGRTARFVSKKPRRPVFRVATHLKSGKKFTETSVSRVTNIMPKIY